MKIRKVKDTIWRRHLRIDAQNKRMRERMLRRENGTEEQLYLAKICIVLDRHSMQFATKQLKQAI